MSKYTLELRYLYKDKNFKLYDFPYNLYVNHFIDRNVELLNKQRQLACEQMNKRFNWNVKKEEQYNE